MLPLETMCEYSAGAHNIILSTLFYSSRALNYNINDGNNDDNQKKNAKNDIRSIFSRDYRCVLSSYHPDKIRKCFEIKTVVVGNNYFDCCLNGICVNFHIFQ